MKCRKRKYSQAFRLSAKISTRLAFSSTSKPSYLSMLKASSSSSAGPSKRPALSQPKHQNPSGPLLADVHKQISPFLSHMVLNTIWPFSFCRYEGRNSIRRLTIHALYIKLKPDSTNKQKTAAPGFRSDDLRIDSQIRQFLNNSDNMKKMKSQWPSLNPGETNIDFWTREYKKHGLKAGFSPETYFTAALMLHKPIYDIKEFETNAKRSISNLIGQIRQVSATPRLHVVNSRLISALDGRDPDIHVRDPCNVLEGASIVVRANDFEYENYRGITEYNEHTDFLYIPYK